MLFFRPRNLLFITFIFCTFFICREPVEGHPHLLTLMVLLPALLLKAGLAAPIVLIIIAKIGLLLGLKLKLLLPLLGIFGSTIGVVTTESPYGTPYGGGFSISRSDDNLGRIKRSAEFVQSLVGDIQVDENQLLDQVFKMDTNKCGERLLCEVAAAHALAGVGEEEAALISLFSSEEAAVKKAEETKQDTTGSARHAYSKALLSGYKNPGSNCASTYPTCPYSREEMMQVVQIVNHLHLSEQAAPSSARGNKQSNDIPYFDRLIKT